MKGSTLIKQSPSHLLYHGPGEKKYPALAQLQSLLIEELSGKGDLCKFWSQLVSITTYLTYLLPIQEKGINYSAYPKRLLYSLS